MTKYKEWKPTEEQWLTQQCRGWWHQALNQCWWEDNRAGKVQDTQRHRILQKVCMVNRSEKWGGILKICVREDRSLWFLLSYLEETVFYYLEKLNQKGSKLWKPGITRIDGRPGTKIRKFPALSFIQLSEFQWSNL